MIRFVANDKEGLPLKRKSSQIACDRCRKRLTSKQKRCNHQKDDESPLYRSGGRRRRPPSTTTLPTSPSIGHTNNLQSPAALQRNTYRTDHRESEALGPRAQEDFEKSHFVGDLSPEGIFLATQSPPNSSDSAVTDGVGVWLSGKAPVNERRYDSIAPARGSQSRPVYWPDPVVSRLSPSHLEEQCLAVGPSDSDFTKLSEIYWKEVHPLFPVLDPESYGAMPKPSPEMSILNQTICLAASTSWNARRYLKLTTYASCESRKEFAGDILLAVLTSLNLGVIKDKLVLVQVYSLLSFFTQFSGDRHRSAELCSRAVSHAQTIGLHLQTAHRKNNEFLERVFCCVWALDRLNAAFLGRPVIIHERDLGRDLNQSIQRQDASFQLLLRTILLLDKVIESYRPHTSEKELNWEGAYPNFEDVVGSAGAYRVNPNLMATIEILYHAVSMLLSRPQSLREPLPSSASYVRQRLSAARVIAIVGEEFSGSLSLLPIVPYAVSLSLRVSYRELRLCKVPMFRARARKELLACCHLLRDLGTVFSSAVTLADLAENTVREMEKVVSQMSNKPSGSGAEGSRLQESRPTDTPTANQANNNYYATGLGPREMALSDHETQSLATPEGDPSSFDVSAFDSLPELDIFEYFDPGFDLGAVDAALGNGAPFLADVDAWTSGTPLS